MKRRILYIACILLKHGFLLLTAAISLLPLVSCLLVSVKSPAELSMKGLLFFGDSLHWENYVQVLQAGLSRGLLASAIVVTTVVVISGLLNAMVAYVLSRFRFRGQHLILGILLFLSFLPSVTMHVYIFRIMVAVRLVNTLTGYIILLCGVDIVSVFIFTSYFSTIPTTIDDAAIVDGCSLQGVFFRIHIPMLRKAFFTVGLIRGIVVYNEYFMSSIYLLDKSKYQTVPITLYLLSAPFATIVTQLKKRLQ